MLMVLLFIFPFALFAKGGYSFFTSEDMQNIRTSVQTEWGRPIMEKLEITVNERRKHSLSGR